MRPNGLPQLLARTERQGACLIYTGPLFPSGYGIFSYRNRPQRAHRVSWIVQRGEIPDGLEVCHSCDIPACVEIDHLWLGTRAENHQDMVVKGRSTKGRVRGPMPTETRALLAEAANRRWENLEERARVGRLSGAARMGKKRGPYRRPPLA